MRRFFFGLVYIPLLDGGDRILYIVDYYFKLPYPLLDFPQTCVVFNVGSYDCIVVWLLSFLVELVAQV